MRSKHEVEQEEERLSTEEVHVLRARFYGDTSPESKPIATVADLAELLGKPTEEVRRHLDQLRAEKAFATSAPKKASQLPLVGIAAVLLVAAFGLYKITTRNPAEEQVDDQLAQFKREQAAKPAKVHYPIAKTIYVQDKPAPGFSVTFNGELTSTTYHGAETIWPGTDKETEAKLGDALQKAYDDALNREKEAPKPSQPLKKSSDPYRPQPGPGHFVVNLIAGGMGQHRIWGISTDPALAGPQIAATARDMVQRMRKEQDQTLNQPRDNVYEVVPPPGFHLEIFAGPRNWTKGTANLGLRPIDPVKVRQRLDLSLRDLIRRTLDLKPPANVDPNVYASKPDLTVKIIGPLRPFEVGLPLKAGGKYATAADAMQAYEQGLKQVLDEGEKQIREINARKE